MSDIQRLGIGEVITTHQEKDAIHIPIIPVVAGEELKAGEHVKIENNCIFRTDKESIGVVDPYIRGIVLQGEGVWLFLHPGSVISLRHDWTHLSFIDEETKKKSEEWLRNFCSTHNCPRYEIVMMAIEDDLGYDEDYGCGSCIDDERLHFNGYDAGGIIPTEFWDHAEIVLGKKLPYKPKYFSCSC